MVAAAPAGAVRQPSIRPGSVPVPDSPRAPVDHPPVVSLGAWADIAEEGPGPSVDLDVCEFAILADGRCLTIDERGYGWSGGEGPWAHDTVESITEGVLSCVLPDDDETAAVEDHPWSHLVWCLAQHGVVTDEGHLRAVPYEVELSDRILARLDGRSG